MRTRSKAIKLSVVVMSAICCVPAYAQQINRLNEAVATFNKGNYMESLALFNQAKATDSDNPLLHYYMACALMKLNQKQDAIREFKMTLLLEPSGKFAPLCQQALRALGADGGAAPSAVQGKSGKGGKKVAVPLVEEPVRKEHALQTPQVVTVLCGCPLCHRVDMIMTDLNTKYGDKIEFIRAMRTAADEKTQTLIKTYDIRKCPTVLLIGNRGEPCKEFTGSIPEQDLYKDIGDLYKGSTRFRYESTEDKNMASMRKSIVDEVEARIANDQIRVDYEIKKLEQEGQQDQDSIGRKEENRDAMVREIQEETSRKIKFVRDDFERRKKEWNAAAQAKIQNLLNAGSYARPKQPQQK